MKTPLPIAKRFRGLFWTQFFGALNDNIFKNALIIMITFKGGQVFGLPSSSMVALAGGVFILPFFLFSGVSGRISDKFDRARIARFVKWFELTVMTMALIGFYFKIYPLLLFLLLMMGIHSTLFGPLKYSVIPELVEAGDLAAANGWVEFATYFAILLGMNMGTWAVSSDHEMMWLAIALGGVSAAGIASSYMIPTLTPTSPDLKLNLNIFGDIADSWRLARRTPIVFQSILGISWFWFLGSVLLSILPVYVREHLGANEQVATFFLTIFTIGIGIGSFIATVAGRRMNMMYLVGLGIVGMSAAIVDWAFLTRAWPPHDVIAMSFDLFRLQEGFWHITLDLLLIAIMAGLFTLPLYTWMQVYSASSERSRIVGANNLLNAAFMVGGALGLMVLYHLHLGFMQIFLVIAALNFLWAVIFHFTLRPLAGGTK